jgi:hypothetical protein
MLPYDVAWGLRTLFFQTSWQGLLRCEFRCARWNKHFIGE